MCQSFRRKAVYFTIQNALNVFDSVSLQDIMGNLNSSKPSLAGLSCKNKE